MSFAQVDLQNWLKGLGLSPEKAKVVEEAFSAADVLPKVGETILTRSEFSRKMDELAKNEQKIASDLADKQSKVDQFYAQTAEWRKGKEQELSEARAAVTAAQGKLAGIRTNIDSIAAQYGVDKDDLKFLDDIGAAPANPNPAAGPSGGTIVDGKYVTKEDFDRTAGQFANFPLIPAVLHDITVQHRKLFGTDLENTEQLIADAIAAKKPLKEFYESKYSVAAKREEVAKANTEAEITRRVTEEVTRRQSELNNPASPVARESLVAPILREMPRQKADSNQPNDPMRGVKAAIASYGTHTEVAS